jgi:uncharacterized protein YecT (DUF1311 family)
MLFLVAFLFFAPLSVAGTICNSSVTSELEACAKSNFSEADKKLNAEYKELVAALPASERSRLVDAQRDWIKYKDSYCQAAFEAASPGEEAGIDKWSCLESVTRVRTKELKYIQSATDVEDFYHAIAFIADAYEGGSKGKVIDKLSAASKSGEDHAWTSYVQKNCQLTASRLHEEHKVCVARQNFYRDWFQ